MIDEEMLTVAKEVLADATKDNFPASTQVWLQKWSPELLDTLSKALAVVRAAQKVDRNDVDADWKLVEEALIPFSQAEEKK